MNQLALERHLGQCLVATGLQIGTRDGSIMATIITTHIPMNEAAAPSQVCPGILIHAIDMVQPPGIAMPPELDPHQ